MYLSSHRLGDDPERLLALLHSSRHPQAEAAERLIARYRTEGVAYRALRDGQAIVITD